MTVKASALQIKLLLLCPSHIDPRQRGRGRGRERAHGGRTRASRNGPAPAPLPYPPLDPVGIESFVVDRACACVAADQLSSVSTCMVIMAGMLPGVECARRRRLRQGGGAEAAAMSRRTSFCLYAAGHGGAAAAHHYAGAGNSGSKQQRSSVMELVHGWTLDSNAREAKERLDQKLRSNRADASIKRHHSTGSIKLSRAGGGGGAGSSAAGVQREVYSRKGVMRQLMRWSRLRWDAAEQAECAVCLEEFATGDVLAHLPCGHRFHWGCALPWLERASHSCPFCRAAVDAGVHAAS